MPALISPRCATEGIVTEFAHLLVYVYLLFFIFTYVYTMSERTPEEALGCRETRGV